MGTLLGMFAPTRSKDRILGHFAWEGEPITVRTHLRPDGTVIAGVDFFDRVGALIYSTTQQVGTLADAMDAFGDWQRGLEPGPVYPGDDNGESANAQAQVDAMQARDPMARLGVQGLGRPGRGIRGR